jgi:hypothetical protein
LVINNNYTEMNGQQNIKKLNQTFACIGCPTRYRNRLAGGPLLRVATIKRNTDTLLFISRTTNVLLFKFRCNILIGVRIIKEKPGSVVSGTHCINTVCQKKHEIL